jgi:hypothetical protein
VIAPGTQMRLMAIVFAGLVLGGCSVMGSLRLGVTTLGLQNGLFVGSDVGNFVH